MERGIGLGGNLGEDQDDQGQQPGGDADRRLAAQTQRDDGGQRRGHDIGEVVAEQDESDQPIRSLQQFAGDARAAMSLIGQVPQLVAVHGQERGLGAGEKGREQDQHE